jgi:serine/threonine-protein kinase
VADLPSKARTESSVRAFVPGEILANRYRIVSLLGRGGMGEVYRADDLRTAQPVALKFVITPGPADAALRERLLREAQLARQITHPNVCRIYDIGERGDELYLSMEYIDGENLRSLLRRVGRLPFEKALDVAQQLCAGLAAAHDHGILHLDLKPENVMVDGRGRALITDFGVARRIDQDASESMAGTPSYMAPEQRSAGALTVQTDLYALGLVLFEVFTGIHAGSGNSLVHRITDAAKSERLSPTQGIRHLDPQVEHVIAVCLQPVARDRPHSATAVAAALPGGEPFSAAIAAGRTLSPAMIAAARREVLRPAVVAVLAIALMGEAAAVGIRNRKVLLETAPPFSPAVLLTRAEDTLQSLGHRLPHPYRAYWFTSKRSYREQVLDRTAPFSLDEHSTRSTPHLLFVLRESPAPLLPANVFGLVFYRDPPSELPGMADVTLDGDGRLIRMCAIPEGPSHASSARVDWSTAFTQAGLRFGELTAVPPLRIPPVAYDSWTEWKTSRGGSSARVTAAAFDGTPVYFDIDDDERAMDVARDQAGALSRLTADPTIVFVAAAVGLAVAVFIARHHLLRGDADTRGMSRLALYFFVLNAISIALLPDHVDHFGEEYFLIAKLLAWGLYWCASAAVLYLAFEPTVRRRSPESLIGWNRLMAGRVGDPLVGRDLLVGVVAGTLTVCLMWAAFAEGAWFHAQTSPPFRPALESFRDPRHVTALIVFLQADAVSTALGGIFLFALLSRLVRSKWIASALWIAVFVGVSSPGLNASSEWKVALPLTLAPAIVAAFVLIRFGLLALAATVFTTSMWTRSPAALEFSAWYAARSLTALIVVIGLAAYGAYLGFSRHPRTVQSRQRVAPHL